MPMTSSVEFARPMHTYVRRCVILRAGPVIYAVDGAPSLAVISTSVASQLEVFVSQAAPR
jgi:hypothetical protein